MAPGSDRGVALALAGIGALLLATLLAYRPPAALGPYAPTGVFSAARAQAVWQDLAGSGLAHPIGSSSNQMLRQDIVARLQALGYHTELQSGIACREGTCGNPVNIIAWRDAGASIDDAVLLAAHYDSVPAGPGAADDGAAVASVLEIARILATRSAMRHPVILLISDGEEAGLLGATLFVRDHPLARHIKAAVNLEARGVSGMSLMFETGAANAWLMRLYAAAVARPVTNSLFYVVYKLLPNDTDFTVFKAAGFQGFNLAFIGDVARYHTPQDNVTNLDARSVQHQGDNALAAVTALAQAPSIEETPRESVYFDVFGRGLVAWPARATLPASILVALVLLAQAALLWRRRIATARQMLWGAVGVACMLLAGTALCAATLYALIAAGKLAPLGASTWIAHPQAMHCAAAAMAFVAAGLVAAWLDQRAGYWGFWAAAVLAASLLSVICALLLPGASILVLPAAAVASVASLPYPRSILAGKPLAPWMALCACLAPVWASFAVTLPVMHVLYDGLGELAWPVLSLLTGLGIAALLPLLAVSPRARRSIIAAAGCITVAGLTLTSVLPVYSAEWPQRINLGYWLDADKGEAHFAAECDAQRLPASLAAAEHFERTPRPRFPGSGVLAFLAPATPLALPPPSLSIVSVEQDRLRVHFQSTRNAAGAFLIFPAAAHIVRVQFETPTGPLSAPLVERNDGSTELNLASLPPAGVDFSFAAEPDASLRVQLFDASSGLAGSSLLSQARTADATSSREGDETVVYRTVTLDPAAGR